MLEYFGFIAMNLVEFWYGFLVGCGDGCGEFEVREREREGVTRGACEDTGLKGVKLTNGVGT